MERMEKREKKFFLLMIVVAVAINAVMLSPLIPWQRWMLWHRPFPERVVWVEVENCQMKFPDQGIEIKANEFVKFVATSKDVTYGFGVFRQDGSLVFQMQVIPGYENSIIWKFDAPGSYDVRSTEYSGPRHPEMFYRNILKVSS